LPLAPREQACAPGVATPPRENFTEQTHAPRVPFIPFGCFDLAAPHA
jgi:hypothetical protein